MYFADFRWWQRHHERPAFTAFAGQLCSIQAALGGDVDHEHVHMLRNDGSSGMPKGPNALTTGPNGGYQALLLALLAGARRVLLLGYDMRFTPEGKTHFHSDHPKEWRVAEDMYREYAKMFAGIKPHDGVEVLNCTPGSAIKAFPHVPLGEALARA